MAASANTATNNGSLLKTAFEGGDPIWSALEESKLLAEIGEDRTYAGDDNAHPLVVRYSMGAGVSADFPTALAGAKHTREARFSVPMRHLYGVRYIDGDFIERTKGKRLAYVDGIQDAIVQGRTEYNSILAQQVWSKAGGSIARLPATVTLTGADVVFTDPFTAALFEVDREYCFASDDGTAVSPAGLRDSGASLTVTKVSLETKTVTFSANLNTIAAIAASDYIHLKGNYSIAIDGILAWLPLTAPSSSESFKGVDRSVAPNKLAGYRYSGGGRRKSDAVGFGLAEARAAGVRTPRLYVDPITAQEIAQEVGSYSTVPLGAANPKLGHTGIRWAGSGETILVEDSYAPRGYAIGLDPKDWRLWSTASGFGHIQNEDSLTRRYLDTEDALVIRFAGYGPGVCPKSNGRGPGNGLIITF